MYQNVSLHTCTRQRFRLRNFSKPGGKLNQLQKPEEKKKKKKKGKKREKKKRKQTFAAFRNYINRFVKVTS